MWSTSNPLPDDAEVWIGGNWLEDLVVQFVEVRRFVRYAQYVAPLGVEFHSPEILPIPPASSGPSGETGDHS